MAEASKCPCGKSHVRKPDGTIGDAPRRGVLRNPGFAEWQVPSWDNHDPDPDTTEAPPTRGAPGFMYVDEAVSLAEDRMGTRIHTLAEMMQPWGAGLPEQERRRRRLYEDQAGLYAQWVVDPAAEDRRRVLEEEARLRLAQGLRAPEELMMRDLRD